MKSYKNLIITLAAFVLCAPLFQPDCLAAYSYKKQNSLETKAKDVERKHGPTHADTLKAQLNLAEHKATNVRIKGLYQRGIVAEFCRIYTMSTASLGPEHKLTRQVRARLDKMEPEIRIVAGTLEKGGDWYHAGCGYIDLHRIGQATLGDYSLQALETALKAGDAFSRTMAISEWNSAATWYAWLLKSGKNNSTSSAGEIIKSANAGFDSLLAKIKKESAAWERDRYNGRVIDCCKIVIYMCKNMGGAYAHEAVSAQQTIDRLQPGWDAHLARVNKQKQEQKAKEDREYRERMTQINAQRRAEEANKPKDLCSWCDGRGRKGCWSCQATGRTRDHNGRDYGMCGVCSGHGYQVCTTCKGTGHKQ